MALGERYNLTFSGDTAINNIWKIEIHEEGYGGASSSVKADRVPFIRSYKGGELYEPIRASEVTVNLIAETNFQFSSFFTPSEFQFVLIIKKNGAIWWQGIQVVENYQEPYTDVPYKVQLRFSDGLGILGFKKFETGGNLISGIATVNDYSDIVANGFMNTTYIDQSAFRVFNENISNDEGMMCLDVLRKILIATGSTIYQSDNKWHIFRIEEAETASPAFIDYLAGSETIDTTGTVTIRKSIINSGTGPRWILVDQELMIQDVYSEIVYSYDYKPPTNDADQLIKDWTFLLKTGAPAANRFDFFSLTADYAGSNKKSYVNENVGLLEPLLITTPVLDITSSITPLDTVGNTVTYQNLFTTTNDTSVLKILGKIHLKNIFPRTAEYGMMYTVKFYFEITIGSYKIQHNPITNVLEWVTAYTIGYDPETTWIRVFQTFNIGDDHIAIYGTIPDMIPIRFIRYEIFSANTVHITDDGYSTDLDDIYVIGDVIRVAGANNSIHNGTFTLTAVGISHVEFVNPAITDSSQNEDNGPGKFQLDSEVKTKYNIDANVELPPFPETSVNDITVKMYTPVNPTLHSGFLTCELITLHSISYRILPDNETMLNQQVIVSTNTNVRDRRLIIPITLGDAGHVSVKNSFKAKPGADYVKTDLWFRRGAPGTTDSAAMVLIIDPYSKYYSTHRRNVSGTLFGDFDFYNVLQSTDSLLYLQNNATFNPIDEQTHVDLLEIKAFSPTITIITDEFTDVKDDFFDTGNDDTGPYDENEVGIHQNQIAESNITAATLYAPISSPILKINDAETSSSTSEDHPA